MKPPTISREQPAARPDLRSYAQRTLMRAAIYTIIGLVVLVLVKLLYVEDTLGDRTIDSKGEEQAQEAVAQQADAGPDPT